MDFTAFALSQLPPPPGRILELGCGESGGITPALDAAGYDAVGVDPSAPEGRLYRRAMLDDLDGELFDAVVAERVLHHVHPLAPGVDRLARLAPLLVLDEFDREQIDDAAQAWYESQHRLLVAAGREPHGPAELDPWRKRHPDLHSTTTMRAALARRFEERLFERRPYLYRWLDGPASESLEESLVAAGAIPAIGFRWVGVRAGERR
ncbi:MAG TPA: methyltransferase domain-containing protein [Gaiellaceae bacterium]|nr:methyltransferase domain-containing protein [Gaiellaceae bacterium]